MMRGSSLIAIAVACAGCNQVLGLAPTELIPGADGADVDQDGHADVADNCPSVANSSQSDDDHDTIGDACDNCPLVPNPAQASGGDQDAIGDACDAYPNVSGDCLILYDTFSEPLLFDQHWLGFHASTPPAIAPSVGSVAITPVAATLPSTFVGLDDQGTPLGGVFDVQVVAQVKLATGELAAVSNAASADTGYACSILRPASDPRLTVQATSRSTVTQTFRNGLLSSEPVTAGALVRLISPRAAPSQPQVRCRAAYGVAIGVVDNLPAGADNPVGGAPGFRVAIDAPTIEGVAIYRSQPGTPCPPTIWR